MSIWLDYPVRSDSIRRAALVEGRGVRRWYTLLPRVYIMAIAPSPHGRRANFRHIKTGKDLKGGIEEKEKKKGKKRGRKKVRNEGNMSKKEGKYPKSPKKTGNFF